MTNTQITALITAIQDGGENTALEVRTALTAIKNACVLPNEVKWIKMPQQNIGTYFETTGATAGRGIAGQLYDGWAICNGNNLTSNDNGRVSIAYGTDYTTLGAKDGSKNAVLLEHSHTLGGTIMRARTSGGPGNLDFAGEGQNYDVVTNTASTGTGDGINKNMQPYVVELKIQRIA
jgi:hypothetical protein